MSYYLKPKPNQQGFTILELLIATSVLTIILLLVSVIMISIGNLYQKGITSSGVQDNARAIITELAQRIQLGDGSAPQSASAGSNPSAYCISGYRYNYVTGYEIGTAGHANGQSQHVLWRDAEPSIGCSALSLATMDSPTPTSGGVELLTAHASLQDLSISSSSPYSISVTIAGGDASLLTGSGSTAHCRGNSGDQFCAVASLTTTVVPRL